MMILFSGTDTYRMHDAVAALALQHGLRPHMLDCADATFAEAYLGTVKYPSLFSELRMVVCRNPLAHDGILDLLTTYPPGADLTVVLVQPIGAKLPAAATRTLQAFKKCAEYTEQFEPLAGIHRANWIREFCSKRARSIEPAALAELTARNNGETWALANQMDMLCAYASDVITIQAVRALMPTLEQHDEWELSNALCAHDKRRAISALYRRIAEGAAEQQLVGTLASSIRNLLMVGGLAAKGMPAAAIAKETGIHPYVVTKTLQGTAHYDPASLRTAHARLAALDRASKEGRADLLDGAFSVLLGL